MTSDNNIDSSRRIYASLMQLYPQEFRAEYGVSMLQLFTEQCRSTRLEKGARGMMVLWLRTLTDLALSVLREHIMSPNTTGGLLEAVPDNPLPWKGVAAVLIPCLVFFIGQIGQLTGQNWFFLLVYRAGYFFIIPVLVVWLLTRKFPVWGLIPLGMFLRTIFDLSDRLEYIFGKYGTLLANRWKFNIVQGLVEYLQTHVSELQILIATFLLGTSIFLVIWIARRKGFGLFSWASLGVFLLLAMFQPIGDLFSVVQSFSRTSAEDLAFYVNIRGILDGIAYNAFFYVIVYIGFLFLILAGTIVARRQGRQALLLPLGYLIPTVVLGRFDNSTGWPYPVLLAGASVLAYRVLVALIAPIWIARSASEHTKRRAGTITMAFAMGILLAAHTGSMLTWLATYGFNLQIIFSFFLPDLILLAGIALAINLYRAAAQTQSARGLAEAAIKIP